MNKEQKHYYVDNFSIQSAVPPEKVDQTAQFDDIQEDADDALIRHITETRQYRAERVLAREAKLAKL